MKSKRKLEKYLEYSWNAAASHQKGSQYSLPSVYSDLYVVLSYTISQVLYVTHNTWQKWWCINSKIEILRRKDHSFHLGCVFYCLDQSLCGEQSVYYIVNSRNERPTWQGTEDSSQHQGKNRGLPATSWVSTETGSPALGEPWDDAALASSLTVTSWETETEPLS